MGTAELNHHGETDPKRAYADVRATVQGVRRKMKTIDFFRGILAFGSWSGTFLTILILLENFFWFSSKIRIGLAALLAATGLFFGIRYLVLPFFSLFFRRSDPGDDCVALQMGRGQPSIRDRLADVIQVYQNRQREMGRTSVEIAEASIAQIHREIESVDFKQQVRWSCLAPSLMRFLIVLAIGSLLTVLFPKAILGSAFRLFHPRRTSERPFHFKLTVRPGHARVLQGESLLIRVDVKGVRPETVVLVLKPDGESPYDVVLAPPFHYRLESIRKRTEYFIRSGKARTETFTIVVLERPSVRSVRVTLKPPSYSRLGTVRLEPNTGDAEALQGTLVELSALTNKRIRTAKLSFEHATSTPLLVSHPYASGRFIVQRDDRYWIELEDEDGLKNVDPIRYSIRVRPDGFPRIRILSPETNADLDESMVVPLWIEVEDDFGVGSCRLGFYSSRTDRTPGKGVDTIFVLLPFEGLEPPHTDIRHNWDLGTMRLLPEDVVSYFIEAEDNDRITGPKRVRSPLHTVRFPSIADLYRQVEQEQDSQLQTLSGILEEARTFHDTLNSLNDEMKAKRDLGWEDKNQLDNRVERQSERIDQFENMASKLEDLIERGGKSSLLDEQTLEAYRELQTLYREMATPELMDAMKRLQEAMDRISEQDMQKALEQLQFSQEAFLKSIQRTISLLKRIRIDQKISELIERIQNMHQRQTDINQSLEDGASLHPSDLGVREQSIQSEAKAFLEDTDALRKTMQEMERMPMARMDTVMRSAQKPNLSDAAGAVQRKIESRDQGDALTLGNSLARQMGQVKEALTELQQDMRTDHRERLSNAMRNLSYGLLDLSQEQEALKNLLEKGLFTRQGSEEKQLSLSDALDQKADSLYRISQETFRVTPEMGESLGEAKSAMETALGQLNASDFLKAQTSQERAVGALNQAVMALLREIENIDQGGDSGMESFFLQLQNMGAEQAAINRKLSEMLGEGRLSLEEQAAMGRLAADQESLANRLRNLINEFGNRSDVAGNLGQLVKEMEQAIQDMRARESDPEIMHRQERILSRLLDVQRSLHRQDLSRKRQAKSGSDVLRRSPPPIFNRTSDVQQMRRDILEVGKEGYTKDYLELIQKYFEAMYGADQP